VSSVNQSLLNPDQRSDSFQSPIEFYGNNTSQDIYRNDKDQRKQNLFISNLTKKGRKVFQQILQEALPSITVSMRSANDSLYSYAANTIPSDIQYFSQLIKSTYNYSLHPTKVIGTSMYKNDTTYLSESSSPTSTQRLASRCNEWCEWSRRGNYYTNNTTGWYIKSTYKLF
jgi:hypothetical protein